MPEPKTVFVVDDDEDVRKALAFLLRSAGYTVVAFASAEEFLKELPANTHGGCLLLDVRMPGRSGLDLQRELNARGCNLPVVFISGHGTIPMAIAALRAGALDFVEKPLQGDLLISAVERALAWSDQKREDEAKLLELSARERTLTPREREILELVARAEPNKVIAQRLGISYRTVELHRSHILEKLGARTTSELVRMAIALERAAP